MIHVIHDIAFAPESFNPGVDATGRLRKSTRFAPIRNAKGQVVPYLYGGSTLDCAIFETVFHDVSIDAADKFVDLDDFAQRGHGELPRNVARRSHRGGPPAVLCGVHACEGRDSLGPCCETLVAVRGRDRAASCTRGMTGPLGAWGDRFFERSDRDAVCSFGGNVWVVWNHSVLVAVRRLSQREALQCLCGEFEEDGSDRGYNGVVSDYASIWRGQEASDPNLTRFPEHLSMLQQRLQCFVG